MYGWHHYRAVAKASQIANGISNEQAAHRRQTGFELEGIDERVDRLALICEAMWELVCETTGLTDEHLTGKIAEVDDRDDRRDMKRTRSGAPCRCGAMVSARSINCQFCGSPAPPRSPFDLI